jgi:hypothetical protein
MEPQSVARVEKLVKAVLISFVLLLTPVILIALFLILRAESKHFFEEQEVLETCTVLRLPTDSEFCQQPATQNPESLKDIISRIYPVELTTFAQLRDSFSVNLKYESKTCNEIMSFPSDTYPVAKQCKDGFGYSASLPIYSARLWINFDEDTRVANYTIGYDDGS